MSLTLRAMALVLFVSVCAHAQTRTLALYAGTPQGIDEEARFAMRAELQRLLVPAGLDLVWKNPGTHKNGEEFELVAVASFQGSCSAVQPGMVSMNASLADTSITDGRILPFFKVDCGRVVQMFGSRAESAVI